MPSFKVFNVDLEKSSGLVPTKLATFLSICNEYKRINGVENLNLQTPSINRTTTAIDLPKERQYAASFNLNLKNI